MSVLVGDRQGEDTWIEGRRPHEDGSREDGGCGHSPRAPGAQEPQETGRDGLSEPVEGVSLCRHLDVGLPASRTMREYISVVLSY